MKSLIIAVLASLILGVPLTKPTARPTTGHTIADATTIQSKNTVKPKVVVAISPTKSNHKPDNQKSKAPAAAAKTAAKTKPYIPAPAPKVYPIGCSHYQNLFNQYDWNVSVAMAICQAESSGDPSQLSATCDRGLMQVNCVHADMVGGNLSALYDPATNIAVAYRIYKAGGWLPWTTYTSGRYLAFLWRSIYFTNRYQLNQNLSHQKKPVYSRLLWLGAKGIIIKRIQPNPFIITFRKNTYWQTTAKPCTLEVMFKAKGTLCQN